MTTEEEREPWEILQELMESREAEPIQKFLGTLTPADTALTVSRLSQEDGVELLGMLHPGDAAELLLDLPEEQAADLLQEASADTAAAIVQELPPNDQADILAEISDDEAEAILDTMKQEDAALLRTLLEYPKHTAGGIMDTDVLAYAEDMTVAEVVDDMRRNIDIYSDYEVQYAYVVSGRRRLAGVLRMRDLLLTKPARSIRSIMISNPVSVNAESTLEELNDFIRDHPAFLGIPVTSQDGILLGIVRRSAILEAATDHATTNFLSISGIVGGEEFRSMPLAQRSVRRLSWLAPNIVLNIIAASVIAIYQDTLQSVIALAIFLPIISDMSGCSGNQAVAVSIRELSLGLIRPTEFLRVMLKEGGLGMINGTVLGILLGLAAALWSGNPYLGMVVGGALGVNTFMSVLLGGLVPLVLRSFKVDPALASGPILTTVTDMCGFFLVLSLATMTLPLLT